MRAIRRDGEIHPGVAASRDEIEASLGAFVDVALAPLATTSQDRAVIRAVIDLGTWEALRDQGVGQEDAVMAIAGMLEKRL